VVVDVLGPVGKRIELWEEAVGLWRDVAVTDPRFKVALSQSTDALADSLRAAHRVEEADAAHAKAMAIRGRPTGETGARQGRKVGRNEPCPCGSGRKFKICHGA
jgi:preprotein translocase subunit SecA